MTHLAGPVAGFKYLIRGKVQGVGFRPYIFSLARRRALRGNVFNNARGVLIDVEGERNEVEQFINEIKFGPPPLSRIDSVERNDNLDPANFGEFRIVESVSAGRKSTPSCERLPRAPSEAKVGRR